MKNKAYFRLLLSLIFICNFLLVKAEVVDTVTPRIIISSDIGGTDPDDFQSMVHLFVYADTFDIEGIISSPFGEGRTADIHAVIDEYEKDYPKIVSYSPKYPSPDSLRKIVKQGETESASPIGYRESTEGSNWIIECAKRDDSRDLHILVWGGIEDLAQALHDAPEITPKIRVYWIGGPNKKWSVNAYKYIADNFPELWIIESNATYRGWFVGGNMSGNLSNTGFVREYVKGYGAMGDYFNLKKSEVKMGDTPSLMRLFNGIAEDPTSPSWGGQYVRAWERPHKVFTRLTTTADSIEEFGVLELLLPFDSAGIVNPEAVMEIDRDITGFIMGDTVKFLFSPKKAAKFAYTIVSNIPSLSGKTGDIIATVTLASQKDNPSASLPNWWVDDPSPEVKESDHIGAKTVNIWREGYLMDFANRMYRCKYFPNTYFKLSTTVTNGTITTDISDTAYLADTKITITAVPEEGYEFVNWGGDASGTTTSIVVKMDSEKNITAIFEKPSDISGIDQDGIRVYPTVFQDRVTISNLNKANEPVYIELYDLLGKQVNKLKVMPEQTDMVIDMQAMLPGTYLMLISYGAVRFNKTLVKT